WREPDSGGLQEVICKPTSTKTNILGSNDYLWSVTYYGSKGRAARNVQENILGGSDMIRLAYLNNTALITSKTHSHDNGTDTLSHTTHYDYDAAYNLLRVRHSMEDEDPYLLRHNNLDIAGRVKFATVGGYEPSDYVVLTKSTYDFLGRIKKITGQYRDDQPAFELQYGFEDTIRHEYRGNITAMAYTIAKGVDDVKHQSHYRYDPLNRLTYSASSFGDVDDKAFREYFRYDMLGNITTLGRYAKVSGTTHQIDSLQYSYSGLRHTRIDDISTGSPTIKALGFDEQAQTADEYLYDGNGRAIRDLNKGINSIRYNVQDLPDTVYFDNGNWVHYRYSAGGAKLSRHTKIGAHIYDRYYAGGVEYSSINGGTKTLDVLHIEGARIRFTGAMPIYQFDIVDNRSNTLATISHNPVTDVVSLVQINSY